MNRALIVKTSSLGDIVHSFPVVSYLKNKFPKCQIDWMVEKPFSELLDSHPHIDRTVKVKTKDWRRSPFSKTTRKEWRQFRSYLKEVDYDLIIDLQGNLKSGFLARQARSPIRLGFGLKTAAEWPNIFFNNRRMNPPSGKNIREDYLNLVKLYFNDTNPFVENGRSLKSQNIINTIMVCPGANWINKQLTFETLVKFLKMVQQELNCEYLFIWGNEKEKSFAQKLQFPQSRVVSKLALRDLKALMEQVDLVIAMDSLPLHLAGTTSTPTYSIFGPSRAEKYQPLGSQHHSFQGKCPYNKSFEKRCPILRTCKTGACIRELESEQLFYDFINFLNLL